MLSSMSVQSKPTRAARSWSFSARSMGGRLAAMSSRMPVLPRRARSATLIASQRPLCSSAPGRSSPNTCGCLSTILSEMLRAASARVKSPASRRCATGTTCASVAEFVADVAGIAAHCIHFVGFFYGVGRDGREILLDIPRAAGLRITELAHDADDPFQLVQLFRIVFRPEGVFMSGTVLAKMAAARILAALPGAARCQPRAGDH